MAIFNSYVKLPESICITSPSAPWPKNVDEFAGHRMFGSRWTRRVLRSVSAVWPVWQSSKPRVDDVFFGIILANILGIIIIHELGILKLLVEWHFGFWTLRNCVRVCQASYGYGSKIVEASKCWSIPIVICQIWGMKHLFTRYVLTTQIDEDPLRALQASQNMTW